MNKYIKRALIGGVIALVLFTIDWILKYYLFETVVAGSGPEQWNIKVLAGRSLLHTSTTFLDFLHIHISFWLGQVISWSLFAILAIILLSVEPKLVAIGIGITMSGLLGNTLDIIFHNGVRDIFFLPWMDRGTFNLADVLVVVGSGFTALGILVSLFRKDEHVKSNTK